MNPHINCRTKRIEYKDLHDCKSGVVLAVLTRTATNYTKTKKRVKKVIDELRASKVSNTLTLVKVGRNKSSGHSDSGTNGTFT